MIGLSPHEKDPLRALERHRESYDFYKDKKLSPTVATFAHFVLARYYHPNTTYLGDAQQQAYDRFNQGKNLVFSIGHIDANDPFVAAAVLEHEKALRQARRNTVVLGKEPISHTLEENHPLVNKAARVILDNYFMIKVFRKGDYLDGTESEEYARYISALVDSAGDLVVDEAITRLDANTNVAVLPEGTRRDELGQVAPLYGGIADISFGSVRSDDMVVLPMSIDYGEGKEHIRTPEVVIGELIPVVGEKEEFLASVHAGMQECVDNTPRLMAA